MKYLIMLLLISTQAQAIQFNFLSLIFNKKIIKDFNGFKSYGDGSFAKSCNDYKNPTNGYSYTGAIGNGNYKVQPLTGPAVVVFCDMVTDPTYGWTRLNLNLGSNPAIQEYVGGSTSAGSFSRMGITAGSDTSAINGPLFGLNSNAPVNGGCGKNVANSYTAIQLSSYIYTGFNPSKVLIIGKSYVNSGTNSECGGFSPNATNIALYGTGYTAAGIIGSCSGSNKYVNIVGTFSGDKKWVQDVPLQGNPFVAPWNDCGTASPINYYQLSDVYIR